MLQPEPLLQLRLSVPVRKGLYRLSADLLPGSVVYFRVQRDRPALSVFIANTGADMHQSLLLPCFGCGDIRSIFSHMQTVRLLQPDMAVDAAAFIPPAFVLQRLHLDQNDIPAFFAIP
ncbi:hypothetical protein D3C75_933090 [compost metagenome]